MMIREKCEKIELNIQGVRMPMDFSLQMNLLMQLFFYIYLFPDTTSITEIPFKYLIRFYCTGNSTNLLMHSNRGIFTI